MKYKNLTKYEDIAVYIIALVGSGSFFGIPFYNDYGYLIMSVLFLFAIYPVYKIITSHRTLTYRQTLIIIIVCVLILMFFYLTYQIIFVVGEVKNWLWNVYNALSAMLYVLIIFEIHDKNAKKGLKQ